MVLELPIQVGAVPHDTSHQGVSPISGALTSGLGWDCWKLPHRELSPEASPRAVWQGD